MTDLLDVLVAENRRLRSGLDEAERELRALRASRWQRLNPRRLLSRSPAQRPTVDLRATDGRGSGEAASVDTEGAAVSGFRADVMTRGTFSENWFTRHVAAWEDVFSELDRRATNVLEIGSFEGLSACYFLWRLPHAVITCVDTFEGGLEDRGGARDLSALEATFDANVTLVDASRVRKLVGDSRRVLLDLQTKDARFDLVYVDGSHLGLDVIVDAALGWQLLVVDGFLIFDDYRWAQLGDDPLLRPGQAIDAFLNLVADKYEPVFAGHQLAIRKRQ